MGAASLSNEIRSAAYVVDECFACYIVLTQRLRVREGEGGREGTASINKTGSPFAVTLLLNRSCFMFILQLSLWNYIVSYCCIFLLPVCHSSYTASGQYIYTVLLVFLLLLISASH